MKKFTILVMAIYCLTSCGENKISEDEWHYKGDLIYKLGETNPYNGTIVKESSDGTWRETIVQNGEEIKVKSYYEDGNLEYEKIGNGKRQYYNRNGQKIDDAND